MKRLQSVTSDVERHRSALLGKRLELLSGSRGSLETLTAGAAVPLEDLAPLVHDQFVAVQVNQLDSFQLKLIEDALARIDSEGWGVCVDCGDDIAGRRLEAIPWALRCISCQELFSDDSNSGPSQRSHQPDGLAAR
jgi:DnaK suppressor protein